MKIRNWEIFAEKGKQKRKEKPVYGETAASDIDFEDRDFDKVAQQKGLRVYRDMMYDEQVKFCLLIKKFVILAGEWKLIPAKGKGEDETYKFLQENLTHRLRKPFLKILYNILSAMQYGFSVTEKIYEEQDGRVWMVDAKTKFPWTVEFGYDEYGNLATMEIDGNQMDIRKFIIYAFMEEFGVKKGESDLKAAYNAFWHKNVIWKFWTRHLERFGSPIIKGKAPMGATAEEINKFRQILGRIHNITSLILPRSERTNEEFEMDLVESKREGSKQFDPAVVNADARISRALLIPRLLGSTSEPFGSFALGYEQFKLFYKMLKLPITELDDVVNRQMIKPLVDFNFGPQEAYHRFKMTEPTIEEVQELLKSEGATNTGSKIAGGEYPGKEQQGQGGDDEE